jgi:hypothetical protein
VWKYTTFLGCDAIFEPTASETACTELLDFKGNSRGGKRRVSEEWKTFSSEMEKLGKISPEDARGNMRSDGAALRPAPGRRVSA